ncbi:MAG TPA: restriction endonuclease subunit S [Ktedonobacterales bacterium]
MVSEWISYTVADLITAGEAELKTGPFGTQLHASDYVECGVPVINVRNLGFGNVREEQLEYIASETVNRLASHLLQANDIVFGRKGAVERHAFISPKYDGWFQGSDCLRLRVCSPIIEPRFLSYCFLTERHKRWMINQCSHGATMASLNQDIISRIPLSLPPLPIQRKIAAILSAYDDLIENNTRRIALLEAMAQALYREWFVRFRFPGHQSVPLVDSPLGPIPEGWRVVRLDQVCTSIASGGTPSRQDESYWQGPGIPWFKTKELLDRHLFDSEEHITEQGLHQSSAKLFPPETVVMAIYAAPTVGRLGVLTQPSTFNQAACGLIANPNFLSPEFLYYKLLELRDHFNGLAQGAAQQNLSVGKVRDTIIALPSRESVQMFTAYVRPWGEQVANLRLSNTILHSTRDLLLPKLVSGEIDVSEMDVDPQIK